ncbi:hypothetical protein [Streptomyces sp. BE133]|uniref:hypothetical protein n=1 Tax=Streptomyces sp. BE133 TaxID=3002523 RepID=UPI002E78C7F3|nr:hypothetical protein [Streptomyces sp. BE133]MEE1811021.1 hypothetical protein [Streptomyces sp. BE133]
MDHPPHPVRRRALDGTFERMLRAAQAHSGEAGDIQWLVSVGSTIVRAHQHAVRARAGARPARRLPSVTALPADDRLAMRAPRLPPGLARTHAEAAALREESATRLGCRVCWPGPGPAAASGSARRSTTCPPSTNASPWDCGPCWTGDDEPGPSSGRRGGQGTGASAHGVVDAAASGHPAGSRAHVRLRP